MSLRFKRTYQVLAAVPFAVEAVTPGELVETKLSCTFRKATVKTWTVSVSEGWLKVTATVTGWVPLEGLGKMDGVVAGWAVALGVLVNVTVFVKVGVMLGVELEVTVGVGEAETIVTIAPGTANPLKRTGWPLVPVAAVTLN